MEIVYRFTFLDVLDSGSCTEVHRHVFEGLLLQARACCQEPGEEGPHSRAALRRAASTPELASLPDEEAAKYKADMEEFNHRLRQRQEILVDLCSDQPPTFCLAGAPSNENDAIVPTPLAHSEPHATSILAAPAVPAVPAVLADPPPVPPVPQHLGSLGHPEFCARPCVHFGKGHCQLGADCCYCHGTHDAPAKFDKKQRGLFQKLSPLEVLYLLHPILIRKGQPQLADALELIEFEMQRLQGPAASQGLEPEVLQPSQRRQMQALLSRMSVAAILGMISGERFRPGALECTERSRRERRERREGIRERETEKKKLRLKQNSLKLPHSGFVQAARAELQTLRQAEHLLRDVACGCSSAARFPQIHSPGPTWRDDTG
ncbi:unnamed protein product [Symbiodinium natans]|uniref:C3H1-type domain-containing protein n=1 Tax=Symbiodinium natans TaxID=878477 RepID=A0A812JWG7_9DINO|nr:unnamed protein product [Symbiodinium natans]